MTNNKKSGFLKWFFKDTWNWVAPAVALLIAILVYIGASHHWYLNTTKIAIIFFFAVFVVLFLSYVRDWHQWRKQKD